MGIVMVSERCSDEVVMSDYMVFGRRVFGMIRRRKCPRSETE
jgi:hypothetical protein